MRNPVSHPDASAEAESQWPLGKSIFALTATSTAMWCLVGLAVVCTV